MVGRKLRFNNQINFRVISKTRFVCSIILGLIAMLLFYAFLQLLLELIRYIDVLLSYNAEVIMPADFRSKTHFLLAGIAVLVGHNIFLGFLFRNQLSKPIVSRYNSRIIRKIHNEQLFLIPNFIYFFLEMTCVAGSFVLAYFEFGMVGFYFPIAFLAFLVFFLESIKTINKHLGKKRFVIIPVYLVILMVVSFGLSRIQFANYAKIELGYLEVNPYAAIPELDFEVGSDIQYSRRFSDKIKIVEKNGIYVYYLNERVFGTKLSELIAHFEAIRYEDLYRQDLYVYVDKEIPVRIIRDFEEQCLLNSISQVFYRYRYDQEEWDNGKVIRRRISISKDRNSRFPLKPPIPEQYFKRYDTLQKIELSLYNNLIQIDGDIFEKREIYTFFKQHINVDTYFNFTYDDDSTFQYYLEVLATYQKALFDLRKEGNTVSPSNVYDLTNYTWKDEVKRLREIYPYHWVENTSD